MIVYYDDSKDASLSVIFIGILASAYILPLIFHTKSLVLIDFIKGIVYLIFMTPTFINIFSIYAVSNIHDISWGSRPSGKKVEISKKEIERANNMAIDYQNYRSNYLIFWLVVNIGAGALITNSSRDSNDTKLFILAIILSGMVGLKIFFSIFHILYDWCSKSCVYSRLERRDRVGKIMQLPGQNNSEGKRFISYFPRIQSKQIDDINLDDHLKLTKGKYSQIYSKTQLKLFILVFSSDSCLDFSSTANFGPETYTEVNIHDINIEIKDEENKNTSQVRIDSPNLHQSNFLLLNYNFLYLNPYSDIYLGTRLILDNYSQNSEDYKQELTPSREDNSSMMFRNKYNGNIL